MHHRVTKVARRCHALIALFSIAALVGTSTSAGAGEVQATPSQTPWLTGAIADLAKSPVPAATASELAEVRAATAKRSVADLERIRWWDVGGPAYRWNQIATEEMLKDFVTTLPATRYLAILHTAIDDAVAAASAEKLTFNRERPSQADPSIALALPKPASSSYPSDVAAAASAAAAILGSAMPAKAEFFAARADEAMQTRILAGLEYPSDIAAGRAIGQKIAALALARAKADGNDSKWTGKVPQGPGKWQGTDPIAPLAGTWRPWVLASGNEFRPAPPPAFDSSEARQALAELKSFKRTPASIHRSTYWEVFGGARAFAFWNELVRTKVLEYGFDAQTSARVFSTLNVTYHDVTIACFDAKYAYWFIRPSQLDLDLKPVFPPPNHPSYPAAHGCLSTAAATVLAKLFPRDKERLLAHANEAAESRIWAGIHYRFDVDAGRELGRKVAEKVLARAFVVRE